jgi:peptide/nickel transport system permease protein
VIRRFGVSVLVAVAGLALAAPVVAPNSFREQFADRAFAPPMSLRVRDAAGLHAPFVYRQVLEDRLMRRFSEDTAVRVPIRWFAKGRVMSIDDAAGPLLLFGADSLGRDVLARALYGARLSLGVALAGVLGAVLIGAFVGGLAGSMGGRTETLLMLLADFVIVLPGAYLVLVLRGVLPLVLGTAEIFGLMAVLFAVSAWPHVARGVRAIVATERRRDYVEAARATGAGPLRVLAHVLPATRGFLAVEVALLVPALLAAEATISYLGLGFPEPVASWGTMLQDAASVGVLSTAPWMLMPALALFLVVFAVHLVGGGPERHVDTPSTGR